MGNCRSKRQADVDGLRDDQIGKADIESNIAKTNTGKTIFEPHIMTSQSYGTTSANLTKNLNGFDNGRQKSQNMSSRLTSATNENVIESTRAEVNALLERIYLFEGTTETDKDYRYLDEMLTRCILQLDNIECSNPTDRSNRKEAIRGVNEAISILERKLEINSDIQIIGRNLEGKGIN